MPLPKPHDGFVIRYAYLWHWQHKRGQEEGRDRPCMILRAYEKAETGEQRAIVLPISHTAPDPRRERARERRTRTVERTGVDRATLGLT